MADTKRPAEPQPGEKKPGPDVYNPMNMAGKKAAVVNLEDKQDAKEDVERKGGADEDKGGPGQSPKGK